MLSKKSKKFALIIFLCLCISFAFSQNSKGFPLIRYLTVKDELFKQFCSDVEANYMILNRQPLNIEQLKNSIFFYKYETAENDEFFKLAARFNVGQETLATLNHISNPLESLGGKILIIPNCKGIFITENPKNSFESLLKEKSVEYENSIKFTIDDEVFYFYPGIRMGITERAFFLDSSLKMPLKNGILTSKYGMRVSPITGKKLFHKGVDLAAPEGTDVFSCGYGTVERVGTDSIYGNFVVIKHDNKRFSFYAHLSQIFAKKNDLVKAGTCIGKVGSTGASTGPHLHFEIRDGGKNIDPFSVLN
ncbi:MAG: M23 family metallopeptidase [Treponemataceae bacterium]